MNSIRSLITLLLLASLLLACGTDTRAALRSRIAADVAQLEKDHVLLQQRADGLKARYFAWEKEITGGDSTKHVPGLDRTSIWVGDLQALVEGDAHFIAELGEAAETIPEDKSEQAAFTEHYDQLMEGHKQMVQQFRTIADKAEEKMAQ